MSNFGKLNIVSFACAFILFVQLEIMGNIYRISRLFALPISTITILSIIVELVLLVLSIIIYYFFAQKQLNGVKLRYILSVLWIPYFIIFVLIYKKLFPITLPADNSPPIVGLLYILVLAAYPFFVALINKISEK
jgi:hypothetical protein